MPDPEPRERDYIFVGAYTCFGIWIGIGAAGLITWVRQKVRFPIFAHACALLAFTIPAGIFIYNYPSHDRTGDQVPRNLAYNLLQTCDKDSILFTNGDNDTYPLWYLQHVEGVRTDVRVVCLSLLQTPWYVKQLRDRAPRVPLNLSDTYLDQNFTAWPWQNSRDITLPKITVSASDIPTKEYISGTERIPVIEPFTWAIWRIIQQNNWQRPIYFSATVPTSSMAGSGPISRWKEWPTALSKPRLPGRLGLCGQTVWFINR
jgi:hypothetical protein